jgi:pantothenate kinase
MWPVSDDPPTRPPASPEGPVVIDRRDLDGLLGRARSLATRGGRRLLGITGAPGAGKSTLAAEVVAALGRDAALLPMDGFHLAQQVLDDLRLTAKKGAIDTFDVGGFVHLLARVRAADEEVVYAPTFRRDLEEPIAGAVPIRRSTPLVVVEGNYLLADGTGWSRVRDLLDECWFVDPGTPRRRTWLIARHMAFGRDHAAAVERSDGSDQVNAELIESTRSRADVLVVGA